MLSYRKWARTGVAALMVVALLSGSLAWAKKPPKDPPPEPPPPPPVTYAITWLETLGGHTWVYDLNDLGDVVGGYYLTPGSTTYHAYLNLAGVDGAREVIDLNDLIDDPDCVLLRARGINNVGQITGQAEVKVNGEWVGASFRYTPGSTSPLENLGTVEDEDLDVRDINDQGVVVGNRPSPFRYTDHMEFLEDLVAPDSPWTFNTAPRIDNSGRIVGEGTINGETHAYRLMPGSTPDATVVEDLGFLDGWRADISNVGHVAGSFVARRRGHRETYHAFLYTPAGDMLDLGALSGDRASYAHSVNDLGQVSGNGTVAISKQIYWKAFLYLDGYGMLNMDDLIDPVANSEATLIWWDHLTGRHEEVRINNPRLLDGSLDEQGYGQIIGNGWSDITETGESYLLTPVPPAE